MYGKLQASGLTPDVCVYNALISCCATETQWKNAEVVFADMQRAGVKPDLTTYNSLINVYETVSEWERALGIWNQLKDSGMSPCAAGIWTGCKLGTLLQARDTADHFVHLIRSCLQLSRIPAACLGARDGTQGHALRGTWVCKIELICWCFLPCGNDTCRSDAAIPMAQATLSSPK